MLVANLSSLESATEKRKTTAFLQMMNAKSMFKLSRKGGSRICKKKCSCVSRGITFPPQTFVNCTITVNFKS